MLPSLFGVPLLYVVDNVDEHLNIKDYKQNLIRISQVTKLKYTSSKYHGLLPFCVALLIESV